ncbi:MAG: Aldo/keto reductase [Actinomycetia bacterium]|nr:Aldo/keto reductase [Actinomycetes bacterium]
MTPPVLRTFGTTGLEISAVGFGAWAVGGGGWSFGWGSQDDDASVAAMRYAVDSGINWIDTAAIYGLGHSEEVVGRALAEIGAADRPYVFTKCGLVWDDADRMKPAERRLDPASIPRECDDSLRRLGVDTIDLFQFHWPDQAGFAIDDSWAAMLGLVDAGKIRFAGVSNFDVGLLERCEPLGHVASLQPPLSLVDQRAVADEIPWCHAHGTGVIVYSPMQSGLLTDSMSRERIDRMDDDDWRKTAPGFTEPVVDSVLAFRDGLRPVAERLGASVASVAIAWTLTVPGVSAAIVGGRSPEQIDGWIGAGSLELDPPTLAEINGLLGGTDLTGAIR